MYDYISLGGGGTLNKERLTFAILRLHALLSNIIIDDDINRKRIVLSFSSPVQSTSLRLYSIFCLTISRMDLYVTGCQ